MVAVVTLCAYCTRVGCYWPTVGGTPRRSGFRAVRTTPGQYTPHPRAVAALRGARAEAHDDEAFRDPHRSGWQRRIELIVPVSATHRAPACWPCNSGAEHRSRLVPPGSPPCSRLRSRDTHTSWKTGVSLQLGVARGLIGGLGQVSSCWPGPFPSVLPGLGELAAFLPPTRSRSRLCC